jgi:hypothetical protein
VRDFITLYFQEQIAILSRRDAPMSAETRAALARAMRVMKAHPLPARGEPCAPFPTNDCLGLALSGGGIRSATFNLGLLKGLDHHGLLRHVDYLSTVSGGGYVGAWWTTWLTRRARLGGPPNRLFPRGSGNVEPQEVRHLREFSNFLVPRK